MPRPPSTQRRTYRRGLPLAVALGIYLVAATGVSASKPDSELAPSGAHGVIHARGASHGGSAAASPNLTWHGGQIMNNSVVQSIFWGTSWGGYTGDKISGLDTLYGTIGGSGYMNSNTEYTGTNGAVGNGVTFNGHVIDTSAAPRRAPSTSAVLAEVARRITSPKANGYYPVYSDQKRGHAGYCAWHSYGTINGTPVQFAFFFNLDGDAGCDPADTRNVHSQGLEAVANVSGHELSEAVTDPRNGGWWDSSGAENADKCAWTFSGLVTLKGEDWKIQGNWSNAAYLAGTGYTLGGCIETS